MSWKSLTDTYLQEAAGKNLPKLPRQQVIGEGSSADHNINDRNNIGFSKDGVWKFGRSSNRFIKDILLPNMEFTEASSYMQNLLNLAKIAGIVDEGETINGEKVKKLFNYIAAAAGDRKNLPTLIKNLSSKDAQNAFIDSLGMSNTTIGNLFNLVNSKYNSNFTYDEEIMIMRPAGEDAKTRGAAGPGEALFAFLLDGSKPVTGDLDLDGNIIELKKTGGRIGKYLDNTKIKALRDKFAPVNSGKGGLPRLDNEGNPLFTTEELDAKLGKIIDYYSGTGETIGTNGIFGTKFGEWLDKNTRASMDTKGTSTYTTIVQYIAILQLRQYINKVLGPQNTQFMVVFDSKLNYSGFELSDIFNTNVEQLVTKLRNKNLYFYPKLDGDGYQIVISPEKLQNL